MATPVNVWNLNLELETSKPDWPPSPIIMFCQVFGLPLVCHVPLSWVPPCSRFLSCGLTDRLWNCSVLRPVFILSSLDGIRDSICWQRARALPDRPRFGSVQNDERSTKDPLERMTPPSLLSKNWNGLFGLTTNACWSGWSPFGCSWSVPSNVMSVPVTPASVDMTTSRLSATVWPYEYEP